jgi:NAD(P)H-hydrate epimerase
MFTPLPTPEEMGHWDRLSIEDFGLRGEILMENASREALYVLKEHIPVLQDKRVVLFAGSGNNGGDAFALARHLADRGCRCMILHTKEPEEYQGESRYHLDLASQADIAFMPLAEYDLDGLRSPDILVDGLLGTGFKGELRQDYADWIGQINRLGEQAFVLALDIPSGLNGYTGRPGPIAVKADATVTFGAAKIGLFMPEAIEHIGALHTRCIGIPQTIRQANPPGSFGLNEHCFRFLPQPARSQHKGTAGHLLVIGGSPGLTGAPALAGLGALRAGAGLVTVACPADLSAEIKQGRPEIMTLPLGSGPDWTDQCSAQLKEHLDRFDSVVFGPGLGRTEAAAALLHEYLSQDHPPTVFDADGLFHLAELLDSGPALQRHSVLTPHPGEMARLCGTSTAEVQKDRIAWNRKMADQTGSVCVLKGAGTILTAPGQPTFISPFSQPNLAVGGSGDVLAGLLGALIGHGIQPLQAACLAVYWHGLAGQALERPYPRRGNLAGEIADMLPIVIGDQAENP